MDVKPGQISMAGGKKKYKTLWRPDGVPMSVNVTSDLDGPRRIKDLLFRGYSETAPAAKREPKAKVKVK